MRPPVHILTRIALALMFSAITTAAEIPPIEPGVSHDLAKWRATQYSDVRYKLNLTLEKMSPVLKGSIEIRVNLSATSMTEPVPRYIILDWRKIRGSESLSSISNVSINGRTATASTGTPVGASADSNPIYYEYNEHLVFSGGVAAHGENVIKLDFTSPSLASGSAIMRYVDKEDGSEYIYSLFVPSDASTAFPVFDQPDLKGRFSLTIKGPSQWKFVSNAHAGVIESFDIATQYVRFEETKPISTYVFAFAAGPFQQFGYRSGDSYKNSDDTFLTRPADPNAFSMNVYVRKSQAARFKPHSAEVFRLNREGIKYLEGYFDYKYPFPKYDLVLIPEFPFGGMEHAGATFLREDRMIFPQEPTKNDYITRANLIFHEAAHQWFGDTVTMRWFDDLWLKEGFAEFMAYKTLEKVMPEVNAWKVFYERNKQAAYLTDSTKGTTPIYQEIANLNAAKSAYGNIVYRKAPSFLKQAQSYIGADEFQQAVRSFLKKHEFTNASWSDLVKEFEAASGKDLQDWGRVWVTQKGLPTFRVTWGDDMGARYRFDLRQTSDTPTNSFWKQKLNVLVRNGKGTISTFDTTFDSGENGNPSAAHRSLPITGGFDRHQLIFANYGDEGYGIFLLDTESRNYVLGNIRGEKDDFLRTMLWGSLWDSVREAELDPKQYVELVIENIRFETDESTIQTLLSRVSTAMRYYLPEPDRSSPLAIANRTNTTKRQSKVVRPETQNPKQPVSRSRLDLNHKLEALLVDRMQNASTPGQRITYYRTFLSIGSTDNARRIMKVILRGGNGSGGAASAVTTKDKFDIVSRLIILDDPDALKLLVDLEKTETSDEAKRYAYAARAGFATGDNKARYWNDFVRNAQISESWIEAAFGPFNNVRHSELTLPYLERALAELPSLKRNRKIFFVNGWLGAFIGGQRSEKALGIVNKFLADNPALDGDLRLKILENVDIVERAVKIRSRFTKANSNI